MYARHLLALFTKENEEKKINVHLNKQPKKAKGIVGPLSRLDSIGELFQ
jgi:hypothetical protein